MQRRPWILLAAAAGLVLAACAEMAPPPGGPVDKTPPAIASVEPGSLATGVRPDAPLTFTFTEKVDRQAAKRALVTVPRLAVERPEFDDLSVSYVPDGGWPIDTVVVWTLTTRLRDRHSVSLDKEIRGAFTTGAGFPPGSIRGRAKMHEPVVVDTSKAKQDEPTDWTALRAELEIPPAEDQRRPTPWRTADGQEDGTFVLPWLEVPSGPFDLQVYLDRNGNGRRDEREPVASLDSLFVDGADSTLTLDPERLVLIDLEGPVPVRVVLDTVVVDSVGVITWFEIDGERRTRTARSDTNGVTSAELTPGPVVWGAWVDTDPDGRFGPADSTGISEAFVAPDTFEVFPATPETLRMAWPDSVLPFAVVDTLPARPVPRDLVVEPPAPE